MNLSGKKIFVGLSGGVDSAVTAALLQKAGAGVTGIFIQGWYPPGMPCTWADDRRDAMRVAAHLSIPFHTLNASTQYKKSVIDYLLSEYKAGRTPNPDIMCNREVKFGAFVSFARANSVDFIATGHYARVIRDAESTERAASAELHRGIDKSKDQSYFLWAVPQEALDYTLFPLGGFHKSHVRELAKKFKLPVAEKRDSQGICFLGSISVDEFLRNEFGTHAGDVIGTDGAKLGTHDGAILHTLGERVAFEGGANGPWYVIAKDMERNTLTVAHEPRSQSHVKTISLTQTNFIATAANPEITHTEAQYRYHGPHIAGRLAGATFTPERPITEPIAVGQSLVLYTGTRCIGGGIIS